MGYLGLLSLLSPEMTFQKGSFYGGTSLERVPGGGPGNPKEVHFGPLFGLLQVPRSIRDYEGLGLSGVGPQKGSFSRGRSPKDPLLDPLNRGL